MREEIQRIRIDFTPPFVPLRQGGGVRIIMSYRVTRFPTADFIIAVKNRFTHCITFLPVIQETIIMRFLTAKPFTSLRISCSE